MTRSSDQSLATVVCATNVAAGTLAVWWLGQHSWILKSHRLTVAVDLYLKPSQRRLVPPLLAPADCGFIDVFFCTHDHSDHLDRACMPAIARACPGATFVLPRVVRNDLAALGLRSEQVRFLDGHNEFACKGLAVQSIPAAHEFIDETPEDGSRFLGLILNLDGRTVYHSGDTCIYEGLLGALRGIPLDLMLLPINGRDAERLARNCIGNMTYQEAVDLAGMVAPKLVCPAHYGMFAGNTVDPRLFLEYLAVKFPGQKAWLAQPGTTMRLE